MTRMKWLLTALMLTAAVPLVAQDPCPEVALIATGGRSFAVWLKDTTARPVDSVVVSTRGEWDKALEDVVKWRRARDKHRYDVFALPTFRTRGECRGVTVPPDSTVVITPPPVDTAVPPPSDTMPTPPPTGDTTPPVAVATVRCYADGFCEFDGRGSADDVGIATYRWSGGGPADGRTTPRFEVAVPAGSYSVTLTVTDAARNTDATVVSFTQSGGSADPPPDIGTTPVPPPPPAPIPTGNSTLVPASRRAIWQAMKAANDPWWQQALATCALTGTSTELYADDGVACAVVAVTNSDATAARKSIDKLKSYNPAEGPNGRRENFIHAVLVLDVLRPWLTSGDWSVMTNVLDAWASHAPSLSDADSDAIVGEGCGAMLWDRLNGRTPTQANVATRIATYVGWAHGGQWIESDAYNNGTLQLLAMCNEATKAATGREVAPGTDEFFAAAGRVGVLELTPDRKQRFQWGDNQYPRYFDARLFRYLAKLAATGVPEAMGLVDALNATWWPYTGRQLMSHALLTTPGPNAPRAAVPTQAVVVADGVGMLYRRDGNAAAYLRAMNFHGIHHFEGLARFDVQVYDNGWLLTEPIAYTGLMETGLLANTALYAGLNLFNDARMTWADSGNGWAAIAGVVKGPFSILGYPGNTVPPFLHYGGRTIVSATVEGQQVVLVRDSVSMEDPRTLANYNLYRETSTYQHQSRIADFNGWWAALWHMPESPTFMGDVARWTAPNGTPVAMRFCAAGPVSYDVRSEAIVFGSGVTAAEKQWQLRTSTHAPVLFSVFAPASLTTSCNGDRITVGSATFTVTTAGVTRS